MKTRALAVVILSLAAVVPISRWAASSAATSAASSDVPEVTFSGVVRDGDSGRPLSGAEVVLEGTSHAALTDADGRFFIIILDDTLLDTKVTLLATLAGYEEARREVRVTGATVRVEFSLAPITVELEELVVDGVANKATVGRAEDVRLYSMAPAAASRERLPGRYNPNFHTESYARIDENPWLAVATRFPPSRSTWTAPRTRTSGVSSWGAIARRSMPCASRRWSTTSRTTTPTWMGSTRSASRPT
jgi:hypothetical protein